MCSDEGDGVSMLMLGCEACPCIALLGWREPYDMADDGVWFSSEAPSKLGLVPADLCDNSLGGENN